MNKYKKIVKRVLNAIGLYQILYYCVLKYREKKFITLTEEQKAVDLKKWYKKCTGQELNLERPRNFNEKIQWLKLYDNQEIKTVLSDKYLVRKWVAEKIGEHYLIPIYGAWENEKEIDFSMLPNRFVLKANHGSAMNLVVKDKEKLNLRKTKKLLARWLKTPYDLSGMEQQYHKIHRRVVAEEYIEQSDGNLLDYKIHCFNGEPKVIQVIGNRDVSEHTARQAFFDTDWKRVYYMYNSYPQYSAGEAPDRPRCLEEMIEVAKKLSEKFCYVRVDLYVLEDGIKFGEMTFTPTSGIGKWADADMNNMVGDWIKLENII